ncbi:MAG: glucosylglycerol 3-phosphatase [Rhodocyclaceae bacterium]|nr:glucosylglycerol 3-phosphatase [Rhodocyclaceae bacterium]
MPLADHRLSTDHGALLDGLFDGRPLLLIQDLDGVCMALVRDPLTRTVSTDYLAAARSLAGTLFVLTNGEHVGSRGMNGIVERALGGVDAARGRYLAGLAAGGVQWQDVDGVVSHPGVSAAEMRFLAGVPARMATFLQATLAAAPYDLPATQRADIVSACVLDNLASPTLNLNMAFAALGGDAAACHGLQKSAEAFTRGLLVEAAREGLDGAFFLHLAPNLGSGPDGERLMPAGDGLAGTTDFQFMLTGGVKEAGVLALLNRVCARDGGGYPLGEGFSVREAPQGHDALRALARERIDPARMPRIVGVGDTLTAQRTRSGEVVRGGSDRGFLQLVQDLGRDFGTDNAVLFVDSSGDALRRPALDLAAPAARRAVGISDPDDPLTIQFAFPGGHRQYIGFVEALAARYRAG